MPKVRRIRQDKPFYLIPIILGMAGILFSNQLDNTILRGVVILFCLAVPLFLGGNVLGRIHSGGMQRFLLIIGLISLSIGAVATVTGYSESLVKSEFMTQEIGTISRNLGIGSLLLGLLVVLYMTVRSEAIMDALGDRFSHVADHISDGFALINMDSTIVVVNRRLSETIGLPETAFIGKNIIEFIDEIGAQAFIEKTNTHSIDGVVEYEFNWTRNKTERHYHATANPIYSKSGVQEAPY